MKWTGEGAIRVDGKEFLPGEEIKGEIDKDVLTKLKKEGRIDGPLTNEAYKRALEKVEENKKKKAAKGDGKAPTKKELKAEAKALYAEMAGLENEDPRIAEIETRITEIEEALK